MKYAESNITTLKRQFLSYPKGTTCRVVRVREIMEKYVIAVNDRLIEVGKMDLE